MDERSNLISKLRSDFKTRAAYIQAKVGTLVPSQIRALRLKSEMPRQLDLARAAEMHQSRISMFETPGANPTLGTLSSIAAALQVGLKVEFVSFSEMLNWENEHSQDSFKVIRLDDDVAFLQPAQAPQFVSATVGTGKTYTFTAQALRLTSTKRPETKLQPIFSDDIGLDDDSIPRELGGMTLMKPNLTDMYQVTQENRLDA